MTVAAPARATVEGFITLDGTKPASATYRDGIRGDLIAPRIVGRMGGAARAHVALFDAVDALGFVSRGHAGGKVVMISWPFDNETGTARGSGAVPVGCRRGPINWAR